MFCSLCQVLDDEHDLADRDSDMEDVSDLTEDWERDSDLMEDTDDVETAVSDQSSSCIIMHSALEPSGRDSPLSVDSIPLEWDHTVDVGGSSSPEDEDEVTYYSALSGTFCNIRSKL